MTRLGYVLATVFAAQFFIAIFVAAWLIGPQPRLLWNASASAPLGLYRVHPGTPPRRGDYAVLLPPHGIATLMARRGYLPAGVPLLKRVAASAGARICRADAIITINGKPAATAKSHDRHGRALPQWRGCRTLTVGEVFLLNTVPDSFDGRYFGPVAARTLIGSATPILTRQTPDAPLRWTASNL